MDMDCFRFLFAVARFSPCHRVGSHPQHVGRQQLNLIQNLGFHKKGQENCAHAEGKLSQKDAKTGIFDRDYKYMALSSVRVVSA